MSCCERAFRFDSIRLCNFSFPNAMHGKFGLLSLGKASSHSTAPPQVFFPVCSVFVFPKSTALWHGLQDIYHACVIILVRAYTHDGWAHGTASQHNIFYSEKLTNFCCAPDGIQTSVHWILSHQLSHHVTPVALNESLASFVLAAE